MGFWAIAIVAVVLFVLILGGCAIAWGTNSRATVGINTDLTREVVGDDVPTIEETLVPGPSPTRKPGKDTSPP